MLTGHETISISFQKVMRILRCSTTECRDELHRNKLDCLLPLTETPNILAITIIDNGRTGQPCCIYPQLYVCISAHTDYIIASHWRYMQRFVTYPLSLVDSLFLSMMRNHTFLEVCVSFSVKPIKEHSKNKSKSF